MLGFVVSELSINKKLQPGLFTLAFDSVTLFWCWAGFSIELDLQSWCVALCLVVYTMDMPRNNCFYF